MTSSRPSTAHRPIALVTGGTSGIGAEFATQLAARGTDLVLVARNVERLEAKAAELRAAYGVDVEVLPADLNVRDEVMRVAERLADESHPIELFVNNAGFGLHSQLLDFDIETHEEAFRVMCLAVMILGAAAGRAMKARGHGRIINVSSCASWIFTGNYSAIKAWVRNYSESLGVELWGTGVTVTALCPGWVKTEFHQRANIRSSNLPDAVWVDVEQLVREGLADAEAGKALSIPNWKWKIAVHVFAQRGAQWFIRWFSHRLSSSRKKK